MKQRFGSRRLALIDYPPAAKRERPACYCYCCCCCARAHSLASPPARSPVPILCAFLMPNYTLDLPSAHIPPPPPSPQPTDNNNNNISLYTEVAIPIPYTIIIIFVIRIEMKRYTILIRLWDKYIQDAAWL